MRREALAQGMNFNPQFRIEEVADEKLFGRNHPSRFASLSPNDRHSEYCLDGHLFLPGDNQCFYGSGIAAPGLDNYTI
jgi:hypothetical protein